MFLRPAARKRIGSYPFCVQRVWSISSASLRNPPTTRRFPRSWTRCGSQDRKRNQRRDAEDAEKRRNARNDSEIRKGRPDPVGTPLCFGPLVSRQLSPAVTALVAEEERQNVRAFMPHGL